MKSRNTALVLGITGQDGAYLARSLILKGMRVVGASRTGCLNIARLQALKIEDQVEIIQLNPEDPRAVERIILDVLPDKVYNLSGQSSVGRSFVAPADTFASNVLTTINLLEAIKAINPEIRFYNAVSSECFGECPLEGANETSAFAPKSPYGVAKASAFWMVQNYRESYGLFAVSGLLFNHESPLRDKRFVTSKIIRAAFEIAHGRETSLELGNTGIVRDWGWAPDFVEAMWLMLEQTEPVDFVVSTGTAYSLEEFVGEAFGYYGLDYRHYLAVSDKFARPSDIAFSRGQPSKASHELKWSAQLKMPDVVAKMVRAHEIASLDS